MKTLNSSIASPMKSAGWPRHILLCLTAALLCIPVLRVSGQESFDPEHLDTWLQQERPEWTDSQRTEFLGVLERQREAVLSALPPESAAQVLEFLPATAVQQVPLHFDSSLTLEILEEKCALLLGACAGRPPLDEEGQKRLDDQFSAMEEAVIATLNEVATYLPDRESLDEFNRISAEGLENMRFAAVNPLDPRYKAILTDAELTSMLETIADAGQKSIEDLHAELAEIEENRAQGLPPELLTLDGSSVYIDRVITSTEEMTDFPFSDRLKQLERQGMVEETKRSEMRSIARWLEDERHFRELDAESDRKLGSIRDTEPNKAGASPEHPDSSLGVADSLALVPVEDSSPALGAEDSGSSRGVYVVLFAAAAMGAGVAGYVYWRRRSSDE
ncbi:MAG: hypothetical protein AMXMBFR82_32870 [Candidatus Hydrogenedentota bacterium]